MNNGLMMQVAFKVNQRRSSPVSELAEKKCVPCAGGVPPLDKSATDRLLKQVDGWSVSSKESAAPSCVRCSAVPRRRGQR